MTICPTCGTDFDICDGCHSYLFAEDLIICDQNGDKHYCKGCAIKLKIISED